MPLKRHFFGVDMLSENELGGGIWMFPKIGVPPNHPF